MVALQACDRGQKLAAKCQELIEPKLVAFHLSAFEIKDEVATPAPILINMLACTVGPSSLDRLPQPSLVRSYALLFKDQDAAAIAELEAAANEGQAKAQAFLALLHLQPKNLWAGFSSVSLAPKTIPVKNRETALKLAQLAADQNDSDGHLVLAATYREIGDTENLIRHAWFAADAGHDIARLWLGIALSSKTEPDAIQERAEGIEILRSLEQEGNVLRASEELTDALIAGDGSEREEGIRRLKSYTRHSGSVDAAIRLARLYEQTGDYERARRWFCFAGAAGEKTSNFPMVCDGKYIED
ncbi:MAG: hypothetical protein AAF942_12565 [Pseudomonadota bacterium]